MSRSALELRRWWVIGLAYIVAPVVALTAIFTGMVLMRDDGERLVQSGVTTREELLRVTRD